jgi:hypothetical protein
MEIRDLLFGDLPSESWPGNDSVNQETVEPWATFVKSRNLAAAGHREAAVESLRQVLALPDLESRHYLQAWHFLRALGEGPGEHEAKHLYGVVVEVAMDEGVDIVAAYEDYSARYYNYSGAGIVWEHPNDSLNSAIDELLKTGKVVVDQIGPWEGERPPAPTAGQVRINLLVPGGLHFGQGPYEALSQDGMGGPVIGAAFGLMQALIGTTS